MRSQAILRAHIAYAEIPAHFRRMRCLPASFPTFAPRDPY